MSDSSSRTIHLKTGEKVLVDSEDFEGLNALSWRLHTEGYAVGSVKGQTLYMHRMILDAPSATSVDHKNHNRLDNRRDNLRVCTAAQNSHNISTINVYFFAERRKWCAQIKVDGRSQHLGMYPSEIDAQKAYSSACLYHYGDFACVPFPEVTPKSLGQLKWEARKLNKRGKSKFYGVQFVANRWQARIMVNRQHLYLGSFVDEREAALAYDRAVDLHGRPEWMRNFHV